MGFPIEIVNATFLFIFFAFLASLVNLWLKRTKKLSKDNAQCVGWGPSLLPGSRARACTPTRARAHLLLTRTLCSPLPHLPGWPACP